MLNSGEVRALLCRLPAKAERYSSIFPRLPQKIPFSADFHHIVPDDGSSLGAGAQDDFVRLFGDPGQIALPEVYADFQDAEVFVHQKGAELPDLLEAPVAVEDGREVPGWVVSGDPKIICHDQDLLMSNSSWMINASI